MSIVSYYGTGRRKSSSARVFLRTPTESAPVGIFVNGKTLEQYFVRDSLKLIILQPLELTGLASTFHVRVTVKGGGLAGQAGAIRLGISRGLYYWAAKKHDAIRSDIPRNLAYKMEKYGTGFSSNLLKEESELSEEFIAFRSSLRTEGFLTRDSRVVERKKYGQPGARKRFQFSKR